MKPRGAWASGCARARCLHDFGPLKQLRMSVSAKQQKEEIRVFISHRESVCDECHEELGSKAWITLVRDKGALCLACADLDQLVFLPSGDAALTRRAKKHSVLSAV